METLLRLERNRNTGASSEHAVIHPPALVVAGQPVSYQSPDCNTVYSIYREQSSRPSPCSALPIVHVHTIQPRCCHTGAYLGPGVFKIKKKIIIEARPGNVARSLTTDRQPNRNCGMRSELLFKKAGDTTVHRLGERDKAPPRENSNKGDLPLTTSGLLLPQGLSPAFFPDTPCPSKLSFILPSCPFSHFHLNHPPLPPSPMPVVSWTRAALLSATSTTRSKPPRLN